MEILAFVWNNWAAIGALTLQHLQLVGVGVAAAIMTGVPLGILISTNEALAKSVLYLASVIMTVPSVALFGIMIPILSTIGEGIGFLPAVIALFLYAQLPIIRNTYTAISNIDPALREAAKGMGMTTRQRLRTVEIPIALPIIMAGVRMAVVINVGIATIAAYIGAGGLGQLISRGISQSDTRQIMAGAILVSALAVLADYGLGGVQRLLTAKGLRPSPSKTFLIAHRLLRRTAASRSPRPLGQSQS